ncbi:programmed cell death protein 2 isoform X2 [Macadamia integrifolia]|uniref:programmed cell death protein 2 isoform X2 n=1 Tax=Macadamia integrifolia TaxID=60698 RepID=UPI001C52AB7F|nr:programmed cell death protein 2 isoform X2 [Macadamia integrifolia]
MPQIMDLEAEGDHLDNFSSLRIKGEEEEEENDQEQELDDDDEEDEDEDEDEEEKEPVTLGFVEKPKGPHSLLRQLFPSKAGGVPSWLDPLDLPSEKSRVCGICGDPLQFVLQVYAPIAEKESTFHRTLFVFMCPSMACLLQDQHEQWKRAPDKPARSVKVFRCQLYHSNPFYSSEPPRRDGTDKPSTVGAALCCWCGTWRGDKVCSSCKSARYCSEKHQMMHWRSGHKVDCQRICISSPSSNSSTCGSRTSLEEIDKVANKALWTEFEIISEDEDTFNTEASEGNDYSNPVVSKVQLDETMKSLLDTFEGNDDQKCWASFQERITKAPEQVMRYCRDANAKPLWPMSSGRPSKADIPKCNYCNGPQHFEFQILPQLLYYFGVKNDPDSLDWATIVIYSCTASCESRMGYKEEFAWVQLYSPAAGNTLMDSHLV